jgi:AcrR family transcriptional regulator
MATSAPAGKPRAGRARSPRRPARHDLEDIVNVAIIVFTQRGYDGTSIADLAKAAGLAKSSIYHHVRSKQELFGLAVDHAMGRLLSRSGAVSTSTGTSLEQLRAVMEATLHLAIEGDPDMSLMRRLPAMAASVPTVMARYRHYEMLVSSFVRRAAEDGYLRADVEPQLLNRIMWLMSTAAADAAQLDPEVSTEELTTQTIDILLRGALADPNARPD